MVEGARLESVCRGNSTEGSNPSLSANFQLASSLSNFESFPTRTTDRVTFRVSFDSKTTLDPRRDKSNSLANSIICWL